MQVRDFSWDVSLNLSTSKRYYAKLDESFSPDNLWTYVGARTDSYSYKGYDKDPDGNYIINTNGLMSRSQYSSLIGYTDPDLEYGLANVFKYKNFTLTLNFDGRIGGNHGRIRNSTCWKPALIRIRTINGDMMRW